MLTGTHAGTLTWQRSVTIPNNNVVVNCEVVFSIDRTGVLTSWIVAVMLIGWEVFAKQGSKESVPIDPILYPWKLSNCFSDSG